MTIQKKTTLGYARILVEMRIEDKLPQYVEFTSERGIPIRNKVEYMEAHQMPTLQNVWAWGGHVQEKTENQNKFDTCTSLDS